MFKIARKYVQIASLFVVALVLINQLVSLISFKKHFLLQDENAALLNETGVSELLRTSFAYVLANQEIDASGNFLIIRNVSNVWKSYQSPITNLDSPTITLVTQCSVNHIYNILRIKQFWNGPVSLSIFIPRYQLNVGLNVVLRLLQCHPFVMNSVQVHLTLPYHNITTSPMFVIGKGLESLCNRLRKDLEELRDVFENYNLGEIYYPNNLLRNVAQSSCKSPYVLVVDIDIFPSANLYEQFDKMVRMNPSYNDEMQKFAFIIPVFEVITTDEMMTIKSKKDLLESIKLNRTRPFYHAICDKCQRATNYKKWMKFEDVNDLKGAYEVTWEPSYEPFYIVPSSVPLYDERFLQYGFNRISHACEMHVSGHRFVVLNKAFLLHDGFKSNQSFHEDKHNDESNNRMKYEQFKEDLTKKYPISSRFC